MGPENFLKTKAQEKDKPRLRLIRGGHRFEISLGSFQIVAAPEYNPPFAVDAVVYEEDTFLVLSAEPVVREPKEHPVRLWTRVIETKPEIPGSVLVMDRRPLRFLAIVHDLNHEPSWREEWIESALEGVFREAEDRTLQSIALPLLGTKHGRLEKQRFIVLLRHALRRSSLRHLKRIWLVMPEGTPYRLLEMFETDLLK